MIHIDRLSDGQDQIGQSLRLLLLDGFFPSWLFSLYHRTINRKPIRDFRRSSKLAGQIRRGVGAGADHGRSLLRLPDVSPMSRVAL